MRHLLRVLAAATLGAASTPVAAQEARKGDISVLRPLVRASLGRAPNTAAYFIIRNRGAAPDRLVSAACTCATKAELHEHQMQGGVARMRRVLAVTAPARGEMAFAPGGRHLMLTGLKRPLRAGAQVEITLVFERAGAVRVPFRVSASVDQQTAAGGARHAH